MTTHVSTAPRHTHQCSECGRPFYLCSERDCEMAPDTCRACELDRQDDYMDRLEMGGGSVTLNNGAVTFTGHFPNKES